MKTNEFTENWHIKDTNKHGRGVFASREILKDEVIDILNGRVVDLRELAYWQTESHYYWLQIGKLAWLVPTPPGEFLNHSCMPNAAVIDLLKLVSIRDIAQDEEIVIDYDTIDWDEHADPIECRCGTPSCRKITRGYKFLPESVKASYKQMGIIPEYIYELEKER